MAERENKSQKKREMSALHLLGEQLAQLNESQLAKLSLPSKLFDAIDESSRITSHGARKRHFQFIAGLLGAMDADDVSVIRAAVDDIKQHSDCSNAQFHRIEKWRDRFLGQEADALTLFLKDYPCDDIQQLRQAIKKAQKEQVNQKNLGGAKSLFRLIKSIIVTAEQNQ